jgi:hypothetical protein
VVSELRGVDDVRKIRQKKDRRKEKIARPSRKGRPWVGSGGRRWSSLRTPLVCGLVDIKFVLLASCILRPVACYLGFAGDAFDYLILPPDRCRNSLLKQQQY